MNETKIAKGKAFAKAKPLLKTQPLLRPSPHCADAAVSHSASSASGSASATAPSRNGRPDSRFRQPRMCISSRRYSMFRSTTFFSSEPASEVGDEPSPTGMKSLTELYLVGRGPSSSHTIAPERASRMFRKKNPTADRFKVILYGSLAKTGIGHGTDRGHQSHIGAGRVRHHIQHDKSRNPASKYNGHDSVPTGR